MSHRRGDYVPPVIGNPKSTIPTLTRTSGTRRGSPVNQEIDKIPVPEMNARYSITKRKNEEMKKKHTHKKAGDRITLKARTATTPKAMTAYSFAVEPLRRVKIGHPAVQWK